MIELIKQGITKEEIEAQKIKAELKRLQIIKKEIKDNNFYKWAISKYKNEVTVYFTCPKCGCAYKTSPSDWHSCFMGVVKINCPNCNSEVRAADSEYYKGEYINKDYSKKMDNKAIRTFIKKNKKTLIEEFEKNYVESEEELEIYQKELKKKQALLGMLPYIK